MNRRERVGPRNGGRSPAAAHGPAPAASRWRGSASLVALLLSACDLVGLVEPDYVGSWRGEDTTAQPVATYQPELHLTLTRETFLWIDRVPDSSGRQADLFALKGAAVARGRIITLSIDAVGRAPTGPEGLPRGPLAWSEAGAPDHEQAIAALPSSELDARYEVSSAVMSLILDLDGDGTFDDDDPLVSLTRQGDRFPAGGAGPPRALP